MKKTNATKNKKTKKVDNSKAKATKTEIAKKKPEETMDRPTLVGIARLLKDAGSEVKALKSDTDEALQKKVNEALHQLPPVEVLKQLEAIDPNKLVSVLKHDCFGIFVDFSDVSCMRCQDAKSCVAAFVKNLKVGFSGLSGAKASVVESNVVKVDVKATKVASVTRYEPERLVFMRDMPNPNYKNDDYYDTIERVLADQPENLKKLRAIIEKDFDFDGDTDFMKFVTALRDPKEGVIKLDVDLSDKDKTALREAGYDV